MNAVIAVSAARDLTDKIRVAVDGLWDMVVTAYQWRAWLALGYEDWDTYCGTEFGDLRIRLPKEDRKEVVASLREHGLSLRAIAAATGYDVATIHRDLNEDVANATPEITGQDGKQYPKRGKRKSLPNSFWTTSYDLAKLADRLEKLVIDTRFSDCREKIKEVSLRDLLHSRACLDDVIAKLEGALYEYSGQNRVVAIGSPDRSAVSSAGQFKDGCPLAG